MQIVYKNQTERIWTDFKDAAGNSITPSGSITVTVQYQDGSTMVSNAVGTHSVDGKYFYEISPTNSWQYGYYGAWWRSDASGVLTTQDIPNVFKVEDRRESIVKAQMAERVRSMLYMHADMGGFANKFPRDREILDYLQDSLNWWNAFPPAITFHSFLGIYASK